MMDFLKANPFVTMDDYMWKWSVPRIRLASRDFTHLNYLTEEQAERRKAEKNTQYYDNPTTLFNDLGLPVL